MMSQVIQRAQPLITHVYAYLVFKRLKLKLCRFVLNNVHETKICDLQPEVKRRASLTFSYGHGSTPLICGQLLRGLEPRIPTKPLGILGN